MVYCRYKDEHGCRCCKKEAYYGEEPGKPIFCGVHRPEGWENVIAPRCFCGKKAKWGREGTKTRLYCAKHGRERGMVDLDHKECEVDGCKTRATRGREGESATHCAPHGRDLGMADVNHKRCAIDGCDMFVTHGRVGGSAEYCGSHGRERGMIDVASKRCAVDGCDTQPSYGFEGESATHCAPHGRERGMENVTHKRCAVDGCTKQVTHGRVGGSAEYCGPHGRELGMVDVHKKRCAVDGCDMFVTHGRVGGSAEYCGPHGRERGMVHVKAKKCAHPGCETLANFAFEGDPAEYCGPHAGEDMINVNAKKCASCGLFVVNITTSYLCSYCNPNTSKRQKTREMKIKALLESTTDLNDPIHDKPVGGECGKYRPDFIYDALTHFVVVEVDEDQHKRYDPECERIRMINIVQAVGMRCVFVRYNPDTFKIDGKTVRVYGKKRHDLLLRTIREYMKPSFDSEIADVVYLYYDGAEVRVDALTF